MMALLSPHVARPRWARRSAETKLEEAVRSEGEHLGLLGARDKEVSIETISLAVSGVTETEENITSTENSQVVSSRLELRQKVETLRRQLCSASDYDLMSASIFIFNPDP